MSNVEELVYELERDLERWSALKNKDFKEYFTILKRHKKEDEFASIMDSKGGTDPYGYN